MKSLRIALMIALPMFATVGTVAQEAQAATCDGISCTGTITELYVYGDGATVSAEVRLDTDTRPTGTNCSLSGSAYWQIGPSKDNVIKTLLAAYLAGRRVLVREETNSGICKVAYVALK